MKNTDNRMTAAIIKMERLEKRMAEIEVILQDPASEKDIQALLLEVGNMLSEAECILAKAKADELTLLLKSKPTASANEQKVLVDAKCADLHRTARMIEHVNRALGIILATKRN